MNTNFVAVSDQSTDRASGSAPGEGVPRAGDARAPARDRSVTRDGGVTHGDGWWWRRPVSPGEAFADVTAVGAPPKGAGPRVVWLARLVYWAAAFGIRTGCAAVSGITGTPGGLVLVLVIAGMLIGAATIGGAS